MFKRRATQPQKEQRQIGQPQLLSTTYDSNLLSAQSGLTASNAPSEYFETPLDALSSSSLIYRRFDSSLDDGSVFTPGHHRDVSSVYSRSSHDEAASDLKSQYSVAPQAAPQRKASPAIRAAPHIASAAVSTPDTSGSNTPRASEQQGKKSYFSSHIPTMRKQKSPEPTEQSQATSQGPRTGPSGQQSAFDQSRNQDPRYQVKISGGANGEKPRKSTWGERAERMRKDVFDSRPPWKGGAGRVATVEPVKDTNVPRSSPRYTAVKTTGPAMQQSESDNSMGFASSKSDEEHTTTSPVSSLGGRWEDDITDITRNDSTRDFEDEKDVSPIATNSRNYFADQNQRQHQAQSPYQPRQWQQAAPAQPPAIRMVNKSSDTPTPTKVSRKPVGPRVMDKENKSPSEARAEDQPGSHFSWTTYADSNADGRSVHNGDVPPVPPLPSEEGGEPNSRFSWTTVNTTTTYQQDSPPPSPPPVPVPALDAKAWRNVGVTPPKVPEKPPTPPPGENDKPAVAKALPQGPLVSKTMNHVELLTTQENELALRRRNIQKVIKELEKIDSASPLDVDWKTSKANKKNLEERKAQLSELEREGHEVGLAIARARRKAEREEGIESGLWVRRVTG